MRELSQASPHTISHSHRPPHTLSHSHRPPHNARSTPRPLTAAVVLTVELSLWRYDTLPQSSPLPTSWQSISTSILSSSQPSCSQFFRCAVPAPSSLTTPTHLA